MTNTVLKPEVKGHTNAEMVNSQCFTIWDVTGTISVLKHSRPCSANVARKTVRSILRNHGSIVRRLFAIMGARSDILMPRLSAGMLEFDENPSMSVA